MAINNAAALVSQSYDCLLLVHPQIDSLEMVSAQIQELGFACLNISKELSTSLVHVSYSECSHFTQKWVMATLTSFQSGPVLCTCPDLLFDPTLEIDPLTLFRQVARLVRIIVLWPGDYSANTLSYAIPEHHHYRTWKISDSLLRQQVVKIHRISTP
jgi:hypothetical protein